MAKEIILTANEVKEFKVATKVAETYGWLLDNVPDGTDSDKVQAFASALAARKDNMLDLWEFKAYIEKLADNLKTACKAAANVIPTEDLPSFVKLSKQSYTYGFTAEGAAAQIAEGLVQGNLCTANDLYNGLTVNALAKAAGFTVDKLVSMYPDLIEAKPKDRTLTIK